MYIDRLASNGQVGVPAEILAVLGLKPGDAIIFTVGAYGEVTLGRADDPFLNPTANFTEWASPADCAAYADL